MENIFCCLKFFLFKFSNIFTRQTGFQSTMAVILKIFNKNLENSQAVLAPATIPIKCSRQTFILLLLFFYFFIHFILFILFIRLARVFLFFSFFKFSFQSGRGRKVRRGYRKIKSQVQESHHPDDLPGDHPRVQTFSFVDLLHFLD